MSDASIPTPISSGEPKNKSIRFPIVRQWLPDLCEKVQRWIENQGQIITHSGRQPQTGAYVNLIFAYGLARLGASDAAPRLLHQATAALQNQNEAHEFLLEAYRYRIDQALAAQPLTGPLPPEQMGYQGTHPAGLCLCRRPGPGPRRSHAETPGGTVREVGRH